MTSEPIDEITNRAAQDDDALGPVLAAAEDAEGAEPMAVALTRFASKSPEVNAPAPKNSPVRDGTWGPTPSVRDQLSRHPDACRMKSVQTEVLVLTLGDCEGKKRIDELHALAHGDAPRLKIHREDVNFTDGAYHVLVRFSEMEYQKL